MAAVICKRKERLLISPMKVVAKLRERKRRQKKSDKVFQGEQKVSLGG